MTDIRIHSYTAAEQGLFVNSYLLETADGVVLIDANLLVSDARALAARLAALHKPLLAAFIGDLAFEGVHAYTADGHTAAWLDALGADAVAAELAAQLTPA